ncbi:hypothetical protein AOL_s00210g291 [Orbilia oligospora ATCC 24927]|uniref:Uncharacterized protein n=1 Tax=Arthrobotrys oligospora (strain ATCC 24927 / CBS 115.81 / DSM 1491) TaxID=756982 RepID=G1XSD2_ARTOA|nr:hypothetical protein AOL_s00210g291 [Orbilia oligospora ATCC 24927]EGX43844.1 hypothetical protein AOL_s00210g291 [Orbilia oligospora ATCC 24927]
MSKDLGAHFKKFEMWLEWAGTREIVFPIPTDKDGNEHQGFTTLHERDPAIETEIRRRVRELHYALQGTKTINPEVDLDYSPAMVAAGRSFHIDRSSRYIYKRYLYDVYDIRSDPSIDIFDMLNGFTTVTIPHDEENHPTRQFFGIHETMCKIAMDIKAEQLAEEQAIAARSVAQEQPMAPGEGQAAESRPVSPFRKRGKENLQKMKRRVTNLIPGLFLSRPKNATDNADRNKDSLPMPGLPT